MGDCGGGLWAKTPAAGGYWASHPALGDFCNFSRKKRLFMHISAKIVTLKQ